MKSAAPRRLALPIVLTAVLLGFRFWGQEPRGNRAYRDGDYPKAVQRYRAALLRGGATPQLEYNLGTALFRVGESQEAQNFLESALRAQSPELRARAFYNLGNTLAQGGSLTAENVRAAIEAYRRSLLLDPGNEDARWNLELAMRRLQEMERNHRPLAGSGEQPQDSPQQARTGERQRPSEGEGAAPFPQPGGSERPSSAAAELAEPPFPLELAEQILRAVEERERSLQREKLKRQRRRAAGPDW
ncbi:MAG: tetratricopeptide repeat protein [Gemmatimonadota bacterium]|nr:MAG: tetratricopeptide repeat protein [Gemmatimonadota bacterium]